MILFLGAYIHGIMRDMCKDVLCITIHIWCMIPWKYAPSNSILDCPPCIFRPKFLIFESSTSFLKHFGKILITLDVKIRVINLPGLKPDLVAGFPLHLCSEVFQVAPRWTCLNSDKYLLTGSRKKVM